MEMDHRSPSETTNGYNAQKQLVWGKVSLSMSYGDRICDKHVVQHGTYKALFKTKQQSHVAWQHGYEERQPGTSADSIFNKYEEVFKWHIPALECSNETSLLLESSNLIIIIIRMEEFKPSVTILF